MKCFLASASTAPSVACIIVKRLWMTASVRARSCAGTCAEESSALVFYVTCNCALIEV